MIYYSREKDRMVAKCDVCKQTIEGRTGIRDQLEMTCRVLKCAKWGQVMFADGWYQMCPKCKAEYYKWIAKHREEQGGV